MARRIAVTGAPGSGKTTLLASLAGPGTEIVGEAATDVNARLLAAGCDRPERHPEFLDRIVALQRQRRLAAGGELQLHDRTVFCTLALARFLNLAEPAALRDEIESVQGWFEPEVLFVASLGFVTSPPVRRITLADAVRFAAVHREVYEEFGFTVMDVPAGATEQRRTVVLGYLGSLP